MDPIKTLIVDDDLIARKVMHHMLGKHDSVSIIGEASCAQEAIRIANIHHPDLLFLDIEMPSMNGFSLLSALNYKPQVVFVTAHTSYAVQAFDVDAADYLVKPITSERLAQTLTRVQRPESQSITAEDDTIYVRDSGQVYPIRRSQISAISADSNFTRIHQVNAPALFIRKAISEWEKILTEPNFIRLNRSLIININQIAKKKTINRDKALLYLSGIKEPFVLRRVALLRFRKIEDAFIAQSALESSPR